jgi:hypothetical protein
VGQRGQQGPESRPWDAFGLASMRAMRRFSISRALPLNRMVVRWADGSRWDPPMARFGKRHPFVGGILAGASFGLVMMLFLDLLSGFQRASLMACVGAAGGAYLGVYMGWVWSYTRRTGAPPHY